MALMGARDMSTIDTPPPNRVPVATTVCAYDERVIRDAIRREMKRGGQVFFLHNRVKTIDMMASKIRELVPEARILIGHGQMEKDDLEVVMHTFVNGEADVLLATTIIETGIDIPNANTILIDRADRFGLADLYQLRGRVGRAGEKAYAILLLPRDMMTQGDARKRINAIKEYTALGSGFKIAMKDLEIRGAGNLLGTKQSGHISQIGFELYCQLLRQSVDRLKGRKDAPRTETSFKADFIAFSETAYAREDPKLRAARVPTRLVVGGNESPHHRLPRDFRSRDRKGAQCPGKILARPLWPHPGGRRAFDRDRPHQMPRRRRGNRLGRDPRPTAHAPPQRRLHPAGRSAFPTTRLRQPGR